MKLLECSANKLNRLARKRKMIFFGAGDNMYHILDAYEEYQFERRTAFVIDGNPDKVGKYVAYKDVRIEIKPYDFLRELDLEKYTMVITALAHKEIFSQIQNITNDSKLQCYKAPRQRMRLWGFIKRIVFALPLSDTIVLNGEGDTCENAQALGKYIADNSYFGKYRLIWLCDHPERFKSSKKELYLNRKTEMNALRVRELIKYFINVGRARYLVFENQMIPKLRSDQISIYLNHGSPPIKATKGIINLPKDLNWAVSPSDFSTGIIAEQYGINEARIVCCGSPRTDCLFSLSDVEHIKRSFQMEGFDKIILWVPTFRQRKNSNRIDTKRIYSLGLPIIQSQEDYREITRWLEQNHILMLVKPHLLQDIRYIKLGETSHFRFLTNEELEKQGRTVYDLLKCADAMITDYSTIAFDYMLLDRPIGYTLDDKKEYKLGFSVADIETLMPGKHMFCMADIYDYLCSVKNGQDIFSKERHRVKSMTHRYPDGYNAKRLCEIMGWEQRKDDFDYYSGL